MRAAGKSLRTTSDRFRWSRREPGAGDRVSTLMSVLLSSSGSVIGCAWWRRSFRWIGGGRADSGRTVTLV